MQRPKRWKIVEVENLSDALHVPAIARIEDDGLIVVEVDASLRGRARAEAIRTVLEPAETARHRRRRDTLLPIPILVGVWEAVRASQRGAVASAAVAATVAAGALSLAVIERDHPAATIAAPASSSMRTITMQLPASTVARRTPTRAAPARTSKPPTVRSRKRPTVAAANPTRAAPEQTRAARRDNPDPTRARQRSRTPAPEPEPEKEPTARTTPSRQQEQPTIAAAEEQPTRQPPADDRPTVDEEPTPQPEPQPEPEPDLQPSTASCRLVELELGQLVKVCL